MKPQKAEDVQELVKDLGIKFIRLQFTDPDGVLKNVAITAEQLEKALGGEFMFDGSSIEGFARIEESDMYLVPDPATFAVFPWRPRNGGVARLICDVYLPDGKPFPGDPRQVLRRMTAQAAELGYRFMVGAEAEFFLFHLDAAGRPTLTTHDGAGYFDLTPADLGENARREIIITLEQMGFEVEASHHEVAPGQHEIRIRYDEALAMADKIVTFRLVVRAVAQRHGLHATFMPKPLSGAAGSGMHISQSLFRGGQNVFHDPYAPDELSRQALHYLGGLLRHARGFTAVTNPLTNSYKRLVPEFEAPTCVTWAFENRSPLVRVPAPRGELTRLELRSPDPCCNPYLALAVVLAAGLDGLNGETMPPPCEENLCAFNDAALRERGIERLPEDLREALDLMRQDPLVRDVLGEHIYSRFLAAREAEWNRYRIQVHPWEQREYLTKF
ncbi:MAG: glutamine synthetase family protein [Thermoanaerobacterales bacterium]|nr:glutamine synthetase family protein [Thermoanaerobacterales bacterium]